MNGIVKKEAMGRFAWSKVLVTITSLASVSVRNTVIRRGDVPSENDLMNERSCEGMMESCSSQKKTY